jgi:hypothetical protein
MSCNGYSRFAKGWNGYVFTIKCESIFGIIVDLQRIQINKLTVQMQINMGIISIFDKLKRKIIQVRNMK